MNGLPIQECHAGVHYSPVSDIWIRIRNRSEVYHLFSSSRLSPFRQMRWATRSAVSQKRFSYVIDIPEGMTSRHKFVHATSVTAISLWHMASLYLRKSCSLERALSSNHSRKISR